jgi:hypothetical protein
LKKAITPTITFLAATFWCVVPFYFGNTCSLLPLDLESNGEWLKSGPADLLNFTHLRN